MKNETIETIEQLNERRERLYRQISRNYTLLRKLSELDDAKKILENIWKLKREALEIELEVLKRETS